MHPHSTTGCIECLYMYCVRHICTSCVVPLEKKETQTGNEWRSVCSNTTAFPLRHSSKQNFVKDKLNPLAFKVISCTFYTILWFAMVCELSDMLWDCYAMLWYLYSIKIWNERLNDMVCYGMLCYAIRF